jgi:hypothetical protein
MSTRDFLLQVASQVDHLLSTSSSVMKDWIDLINRVNNENEDLVPDEYTWVVAALAGGLYLSPMRHHNPQCTSEQFFTMEYSTEPCRFPTRGELIDVLKEMINKSRIEPSKIPEIVEALFGEDAALIPLNNYKKARLTKQLASGCAKLARLTGEEVRQLLPSKRTF